VDRRWILGGLLLAGGVGLVRAARSHPKLGETSRVLLIGDSLAQGLSPHLSGLATEARLPYVGAGVSGSRIDQWVTSQWLRSTLADFGPTLILISLGTNDAYSGGTAEQVSQYAAELLTQLPAAADIVWIGAPLLPRQSAGHSIDLGVIEAIAAQAPHYFDSQELDIPRGPDGLHPTAAGYAGWAGALWEWLA
jgi:lysophospholipase L1-like esterase